MKTVHLVDEGQDFLEWDIEDGKVVASRPFQGWLWEGTEVHNTDIQPGDILDITTPRGDRTTLNHPVERVEEHQQEETLHARITKLNERIAVACPGGAHVRATETNPMEFELVSPDGKVLLTRSTLKSMGRVLRQEVM
ncbi:hypothetical protein LCGC14_2869790 [marine sediment metagenome]|uniref:Uncharacterized protein n=1 Tax=marine sediment metagenome TaxID=412755 RepID=A0A0F9ABG1_9ZZZZ